MKKFEFIAGIILTLVVLCIMGANVDNRALNPYHEPVWRRSITQMDFTGGGSTAAKTEDMTINGIVKRIDVRIESVSETITIVMTITDDLGNEIFASGNMTDDTGNYLFDEGELGTDAFTVVGTFTISVDPVSVDANEDMTVDVDLYGI